jgi:hypothetical protein
VTFSATADVCWQGFGVDLNDARALHDFISGSSAISQDALRNGTSLWKKWSATINASLKQMQDRYGWSCIENIRSSLQEALKAPGGIEEKVPRALQAA